MALKNTAISIGLSLHRQVHEEEIEDEGGKKDADREDKSNGIRSEAILARSAHLNQRRERAEQQAARKAEEHALQSRFTLFRFPRARIRELRLSVLSADHVRNARTSNTIAPATTAAPPKRNAALPPGIQREIPKRGHNQGESHPAGKATAIPVIETAASSNMLPRLKTTPATNPNRSCRLPANRRSSTNEKPSKSQLPAVNASTAAASSDSDGEIEVKQFKTPFAACRLEQIGPHTPRQHSRYKQDQDRGVTAWKNHLKVRSEVLGYRTTRVPPRSRTGHAGICLPE